MRFNCYVTTPVSVTWTLRIVLARNGSAPLAKPERRECAKDERDYYFTPAPIRLCVPLFCACCRRNGNAMNEAVTSRVSPLAGTASATLYLGISGVCHPSESLYRLLRGRSPWQDGHAKYQSVPVLEAALKRWPEVEVILTSTQPWVHGLTHVLRELGPGLAQRVVGYTYEDLTKKVKRTVLTRSGSTRTIGFSNEDYWRMNKAQIVAEHVAWRHPVRWVAIDDEDILWPSDVRRDRLVLVDGCLGLEDAKAQDRLQTVLLMNFSPSS